MPTETVVIASDHAGFPLKEMVRRLLAERGCEVVDLGTDGPDSVDYPDYAHALARAIEAGQAQRGVLVCGSGIGMSIAANRHAAVRAALVHDALGARLSRQHNDANVLCLGARTTGPDVAADCLRVFMETEFEGGRHARRVGKLSDCG